MLCSVSRPGCALEPFSGKFSFLFLSGDPSLGFYLTLAPSDCSQGSQPGPYPKHQGCSRLLPVQPPLAGGGHELLLCWQLRLGAYSVGFSPSPPLVMLPSEIPKLPTDPPVRGFPTIWKLLLQDSLPRTGLHP